MTEGTLRFVGGQLQVRFTDPSGREQKPNPGKQELSAPLLAIKNTSPRELNGVEVEFELVKGQPTQIRPKGQEFIAPDLPPRPPRPAANVQNPAVQANQNNQQNNQNNLGHFHNPYNFIPAPPRKKAKNTELGDADPTKCGMGHGSYSPERWSGRISVQLETITPLLIPDAPNATGDNHKSFPLRIDANGLPYLPPTSIKGMLRSAYEAITNSRLSIFQKHEDRLAYRMPARMGLEMVPARVERDENGNEIIRLYTGTSIVGDNRTTQNNQSMYAAWLPAYDRNTGRVNNQTRYPNQQTLPQHGQRVTAWLQKYERQRNGQRFTYWKVLALAPAGQNLPQPQSGRETTNHRPLNEPLRKVEGYVCITKRNIDRKHNERVFFGADVAIPLTNDLKQQWRELIGNYQDTHEKELNQGQQGPPALQNSVWSRHITGGEAEKQLTEGTLCFAHVRRPSETFRILALYPVTITRGLYNQSPLSLLSPAQRPAEFLSQLSPAERVFGWVNQDGKGSYKGNLRLGSVICNADRTCIRQFGQQGFPLAILGQPKPEQTRFYTAKDKEGTPLNNPGQVVSKESGYENTSRGLRGRKVYPHQNLPPNHWQNPDQDRTQQANQEHYQEYRRPRLNGAEQRDDQNRSIQAWVNPHTTFSFNIDVTNLSDVELGGLLWLLNLPDNHFHRLGGGKPLGFGSVKLSIDWESTDLRTGDDWKDYYRSLAATSSEWSQEQAESQIIAKFKESVQTTYGTKNTTFEQVSFIAAFCQAAKGFDDNLPTHYPRTQARPNPEGMAFEWFVENERDARQGGGQKLSLPNLVNDPGLPLSPTQGQR